MSFLTDVIDDNSTVCIIFRKGCKYCVFVSFIFPDNSILCPCECAADRSVIRCLIALICAAEREVNTVMSIRVAVVLPMLIDLDITGIKLVGDLECCFKRRVAVPGSTAAEGLNTYDLLLIYTAALYSLSPDLLLS